MSNDVRECAGFWPRSLAFGCDYLLIATYLAVLVAAASALNRLAPRFAGAIFGDPVRGEAIGFLLTTLPITLYFALSEASDARATWGKRRMHLQVTDLSGHRLSLARAVGRTALKFAPWELAHACIWQVSFARDPSAPVYALGFAIVWLTVGANVVSLMIGSSRQTLYDRAMRTVVVRRHGPAPRAT